MKKNEFACPNREEFEVFVLQQLFHGQPDGAYAHHLCNCPKCQFRYHQLQKFYNHFQHLTGRKIPDVVSGFVSRLQKQRYIFSILHLERIPGEVQDPPSFYSALTYDVQPHQLFHRPAVTSDWIQIIIFEERASTRCGLVVYSNQDELRRQAELRFHPANIVCRTNARGLIEMRETPVIQLDQQIVTIIAPTL